MSVGEMEAPEIVDFFSLPYDLQLPVVKKLTFKEFCRLSQCSLLARDICYSRKFKLPFEVEEILISSDKEVLLIGKELVPLREILTSSAKINSKLITFKSVLTEKNCNELIEKLRQNKTSVRKIVILEKPECEPDTLAVLIKLLQITHLETRVNLGATFFEHDIFLELEDMALRCCNCDCLVHFQVKKATITTQPERPVAQLIIRQHIEAEWAPQGGHLKAY